MRAFCKLRIGVRKSSFTDQARISHIQTNKKGGLLETRNLHAEGDFLLHLILTQFGTTSNDAPHFLNFFALPPWRRGVSGDVFLLPCRFGYRDHGSNDLVRERRKITVTFQNQNTTDLKGKFPHARKNPPDLTTPRPTERRNHLQISGT